MNDVISFRSLYVTPTLMKRIINEIFIGWASSIKLLTTPIIDHVVKNFFAVHFSRIIDTKF